MLGLFYVLAAVAVAVGSGVYMHRHGSAGQSPYDYLPALAGGFLWPVLLAMAILAGSLYLLRDACVHISRDLDAARKPGTDA